MPEVVRFKSDNGVPVPGAAFLELHHRVCLIMNVSIEFSDSLGRWNQKLDVEADYHAGIHETRVEILHSFSPQECSAQGLKEEETDKRRFPRRLGLLICLARPRLSQSVRCHSSFQRLVCSCSAN